MIYVKVDVQRLEYDIHSLIKAFYPEKTVKVVCEKKQEEQWQSFEQTCEAPNEIAVDFVINLMNNPPQIIYNNKKCGTKCEFIEKQTYEFERLMNTELPTLAKSDKNKFKQFLYQTLTEITGKKLPWGNLTGIRPTKIARTMLEEGRTDEEIFSFMKNTHLVSDEKNSLALEIAHRENELLKPLHIENGYSLYIGIPFCPTRCLYCSFTSNPICAFADKVETYIDCLERELVYVSDAYKDKILDSIYIGGGTPTTLSAGQLERLLCLIETYFDVSGLLEFTVEAGRADSITREKLEILCAHHVGRISVNPQTMRDETLELIGRRHTARQVKEAFLLAKEVGFENINMDMILGLPGETKEDVAYTISELKKLEPDSLTVHTLAVKRASKLKSLIEEKSIAYMNHTEEMMEAAAEGAKVMGMVPYYLYRQKNMFGNLENVGYAKPEKFGIYNILIMEEVQTIVALGAGSVTKRVYPDGRIERCENVKDVAQYIARIEEMIERKRVLFND